MDPLGTLHPTVAHCYLKHRQVDNHAKSKVVFIATATYSSDPVVGTSPQSDPVQYEWDTDMYQRPYPLDYAGKPVCNSAHQPYVPPPMWDDSRLICTVKRNLSYIPTWLLSYRNTINTDSITLDGIYVPNGCAWMKAIRVSKVMYRGSGSSPQPYRALTFVIACKSGNTIRAALPGPASTTVGIGPAVLDDWGTYIDDKGTVAKYSVIAGSGTGTSPITNIDGSVRKFPTYLNGDGSRLNDPVDLTQVVYNAFQLPIGKPFGSLPLW
jgi:hypothetical protein